MSSVLTQTCTTRIDYKLKWKSKKRPRGFPRITIVYSNFYFLRVIAARWIMTSSTDTEERCIPSSSQSRRSFSSLFVLLWKGDGALERELDEAMHVCFEIIAFRIKCGCDSQLQAHCTSVKLLVN